MKTKFILFFYLLLLSFSSKAQQYKAVPISLSEGLSQSSVYDIAQDKDGYVWMATQDGLNRFNGRTFTVFREEPFDSTSVSSNFINDILVDTKGRVWVGTANEGLNLFIPGKEIFHRFKHGSNNGILNSNIITHLHEDATGRLWIGTGNGLYLMNENNQLNPKQFTFEKIGLLISDNDTVADKYISSVNSDQANQIWIGTFSGLFKIKTIKDENKTEKYKSEFISEEFNVPGGLFVAAIAVDFKNRIWLGGRNGVIIVDQNNHLLYSLNSGTSQQEGMVSNHVTSLYTDSKGNVWVGYFGSGIQMATINLERKVVTFELPKTNSTFGVLSKGHCMSLMEDNITKGIIWAGFNAGGSVRMVPVTKYFNTNHLKEAGTSNSFVSNILKDNKSSLWIGTNSGLINYNSEEDSYQVYLPSSISKKVYDNNHISGLVRTKNDDILFGSGNQLFTIHKSNKLSKTKPDISYVSIPDSNATNRNNLRAIYSDSDGNIYLILRIGVFLFDPVNETFTPKVKITDEDKLNDKGFFISAIYIDKSDNFWLGTSQGLHFYSKSKNNSILLGEHESYYHNPKDTLSLRHQNILSITEDNHGDIWIGTMNGLSKVLKDKEKIYFRNYSTKNGLNNNVIYSILSDNKTGHLWLSTNNGLIEFHPDGYVIANYDVSDGLQSNEFNSYAAFKSDDGEMMFGGINGYTSFYPEKIKMDNTKPIVTISGLTINGNKNVSFADYQESKTIDLKYRDNSFTVNFSGIHYVDPQKVQFAYMLEGFQDDWIYSGTSSSVNFSQLPPGRYVFRVKASNSDGVFNEKGDMFIININPPFYKTIWFYLIIAFLVAAIIYGLFKYRLSMKMQQVKEVEKIRRATAADFHDELGHKLTIISWFAEILKKKIGPEQAELRPHLDKIIEASGNLYHTMKDMLWAMDPDKDSIYDLYNQIKEFGQELFDNTGIEFEASDIPNTLKDNIISPAHKRHVLLIFKEVMHNSLKHAHGNATTLDLIAKNGHLKFRFRDNGLGFKLNGNGAGRGLENVKRRAKQINAVIDIHSEQSGTVAELELSVAQLN